MDQLRDYLGYLENLSTVHLQKQQDRSQVISDPGPVPGIEASHFPPEASTPPVPTRNRQIGELPKVFQSLSSGLE